jgi:four helix bundle protein
LAGIRRFEDLIAWQKARALTSAIYRITSDGAFSRDFALRDQVRRAAVSIMSNIAEGFERYSSAEFKHFLSVARGSAAEVRSQVYVASNLGYIDRATFAQLCSDCSEISRLLGGMRTSIGREPAPPKS